MPTPRYRFTPEDLDVLLPHEVFVYGANPEYRHGKGAALTAMHQFGAIYGKPGGLQGQSYGIVTKELRYKTHPPVTLAQVREGIRRFVAFSQTRPDLVFYVTKIGCGLAGFRVEEIARIFHQEIPEPLDNVVLPEAFTQP